jgi:ubiquitin carboxyl-terminal hydrolase 36/42
LQKFTKVDYLTGSNKYKCEKCVAFFSFAKAGRLSTPSRCKKLVSAQKQFTVHEAPLVLTIHLKRFTPLGRKIGHPVFYEERISLAEVMSEPKKNLGYSLYSVICHAGGGPNSGHYFAHVKGGKGIWYEMNDESVTRCSSPTNLKNAYILFYIRDKGHALQNAISAAVSAPTPVSSPSALAPLPARPSLTAGMKKRKRAEDDGAGSPEPKRSFIGPVLPPVAAPSPARDPQAVALQRKIASAMHVPSTAQPSTMLNSLAGYSDDDDEDVGEKVSAPVRADDLKRPAPQPAPTPARAPASAPSVAPTAPATPRPVTPRPALAAASKPAPVSTTNFYATPTKRKAQDEDEMARFGLPTSFAGKQSSRPQTTYGKRGFKHRHGSGGGGGGGGGDHFEKRRKTVAAV